MGDYNFLNLVPVIMGAGAITGAVSYFNKIQDRKFRRTVEDYSSQDLNEIEPKKLAQIYQATNNVSPTIQSEDLRRKVLDRFSIIIGSEMGESGVPMDSITYRKSRSERDLGKEIIRMFPES